MADPLLRNLSPSESEGTKWAIVQRWVTQAVINAGISIPMSDPLLTNIIFGDSEGVKWAKLQRWIRLLAENITGGGGGGVTSIIAGTGISVDQPTGAVTITNTAGIGTPAQATFASAAAGNTAITPASGNVIAVGTITGAAGTRTFALDVTGRSDGDILFLRFQQPATASIIEEVRNATAGGTLLYSYTTDGSGTDVFDCWLYFKTGAWHPLLNVQPVV